MTEVVVGGDRINSRLGWLITIESIGGGRCLAGSAMQPGILNYAAEKRDARMKLTRIGVVFLALLLPAGIVLSYLWRNSTGKLAGGDQQSKPVEAVQLLEGETLRVTEAQRKLLQLRLAAVEPPPEKDTLLLPGSLALDPNRLVRIHARFPGEIIRIGRVAARTRRLDPTVPAPDHATADSSQERVIQFGDFVTKDQVLAVVWSREIGEKKSELADAISKMRIDKDLYERLKDVREGVVAKRELLDAQRNYESDLISVARAERTLRSWKLSEEEIAAVYREADEIRNNRPRPENDRSWAELEIRSPINGVIIEKNFNEGSIVDNNDDLFKITDTELLHVSVNAYEEQLPLLMALPPEQRRWQITVLADPTAPPRQGEFSQIGWIVDPQMHTAKVLGWLDNHDGRLRAGQFIRAAIEIPPDRGVVRVPARAVLEEGDRAAVFVRSQERPDELTLTPVEIARRSGGQIHVRSATTATTKAALKAGDEVVTSGVLSLAAELRQQQAATGRGN